MSDAPEVKATSNGISPPNFHLPLPDRPDIITANIQKLTELTPDPRHRFIFKALVKHLHQFVNETSLTTGEWMAAIDFLTRTGQKCTPLRQENILLSDVLGVSALVDALNNPVAGGATENSVLGPFYTEDAADVDFGESIASEGKGDYMYVEGRILTTDGQPIPNAVIETWETDDHGFYDTQYADRSHPDCRGRLRSDDDGKFGYRAVVPVAYPIPGDGPVGELLLLLGRHNMRPNHLHMMVEAPGFHKLVTAFYPDGCDYLRSDCVFGVKKSLVVNLKDVVDDEETRKRGFPQGGSFKLLQYDIVLLTEDQSATIRAGVEERYTITQDHKSNKS
ncbi:Intradiol ring-cleavage dioxygenase [Suillus plorans]|uniref:Intradiol ring-cleavage dioxygenase n=1 Tax=Suillus plorans TaxID=116603 RepID=A0A9P7J474_9AGAM|nr:Intradiol ring-cleavage dioxygenase [Suillus plorans]KAG1802255.1 Intradiol ring-cleavage dioxygenase [Suillus plorans]